MKHDHPLDYIIKKYMQFGIIKYIKIPYSYARFLLILISIKKGKGIIVFSLPKSGSSWLEAMLADYYDIPFVTFPDTTFKEIIKGNSHTFVAKQWQIEFVGKYKCLFKNHHKFSKHYTPNFEKYELIPIVLKRNIFNVIKSHITYVKKTPYHPEYNAYKKQSVKVSVDYFIKYSLNDWLDWIKSWRDCDSDNIIISYEKLRNQTYNIMYGIIKHLDSKVDDEKLKYIIDKNDSSNITKSQTSFFNEGRTEPDMHFFTEEQIAKINNQLMLYELLD